MKKLTAILCAALLALLLPAGTLAVSPVLPGKTEAAAPAPAAAETAQEEEPYVCEAPEGMKNLRVTSALSLGIGDPDLTTLFDADRSTGVSLQPDEPRAFTVFMSVGVPQTLTGFALSFDAEAGTQAAVRLLASNDAASGEWSLLASAVFTADESGWEVVKLAENDTQNAFYALVINYAGTGAFSLNEARLFKPESEPEYRFESVESVEPGELPPVVAVTDGTAEQAKPAAPKSLVPICRIFAR